MSNMCPPISEIINDLTSAYWRYLPNSQTDKMFRILSVVLVLFSLATHGLRQFPSVLDPATVPCNWHPDGYSLYISTSTIVLDRARIVSSNFTIKGYVYEDGIACDPALFFLSPNVSHLTNVSLWKDPLDDFDFVCMVRGGIERPYDLTMLNLTFGRRFSVSRPFIEFALWPRPRLQSLAVRNKPDLHDASFLLHMLAMNELLILDLSYNNIDRLDPDIFRKMYNLTVILLNGNQIHSIGQYTFCGHSLPMLYSINLVDALTIIPEGMFSTPERNCNAVYECDLAKLKFLRLSAVRTHAHHFEGILQPFAFSRLGTLNELQLCGAGLTGISDDTFACLTEVKNLLICDSKIQTLNFHAFSHLTSMQQLLLNNNSLNSMSVTFFESNPRLLHLNASKNMIERLHGSFSVLPQVTCLDFSHNKIDHVPDNTFSFCFNLERLYLQYNSIRWIETGGFVSVSRLQILNLAHNRLFYVHQDLFTDMTSLSELYLNDNRISQIESGAFLALKRLQILNLEHNNLLNVSDDLFDDTSLISELYLKNNLLQYIEANLLAYSPILSAATLAHNPWDCNCQLDPLRLWLNENGNITLDLNEVTCFRTEVIIAFSSSFCEDEMNNSALQHVREEQINISAVQNDREEQINNSAVQNGREEQVNTSAVQNGREEQGNTSAVQNGRVEQGNTSAVHNGKEDQINNSAVQHGQEEKINNSVVPPGREDKNNPYPLLPIVGVLIGLLCLLIAGGITIFKFRLDIQLFLFAKYGIRLPGERFPDTEDQNRTYDAFVSYNSSDQSFVLRELMPKLERQPPFYKLCLHFRDFALGAAVAENIVEAIDTSKRTIMLVSKDFLQSDWCQYEFQMAHHQVLSEGGRNRLILVMMEPIDISDITDHTLKSYIRTHTYIEKNDPRFWERLRFALPDK